MKLSPSQSQKRTEMSKYDPAAVRAAMGEAIDLDPESLKLSLREANKIAKEPIAQVKVQSRLAVANAAPALVQAAALGKAAAQAERASGDLVAARATREDFAATFASLKAAEGTAAVIGLAAVADDLFG